MKNVTVLNKISSQKKSTHSKKSKKDSWSKSEKCNPPQIHPKTHHPHPISRIPPICNFHNHPRRETLNATP